MPAWVWPKERSSWVSSSRKERRYGSGTEWGAGAGRGCGACGQGERVASLFSGDSQVIACAHDYLKAYAIDCLLTAVLFCFVGYFNGFGKTIFVMVQGVIGAFFVRIPVVFLIQRLEGATLFHIGLATPLSSLVQIALCLLLFLREGKKPIM